MAATSIIPQSAYDFATVESLREALCAQSQATADWLLNNYDENTTVATVNDGAAEARRLQSLLTYNLYETPAEDPEMDELTESAQNLFDVPIAAVSIIDLGHQWFKSIKGLEGVKETPRSISFCNHTIQRRADRGILVVPDAAQDKRFCDNPCVTGPLGVRFYAGAPIRSPEGEVLGAVCILDTKPRPEGLSVPHQEALKTLADCAMANILMSS